VRPPCTRHVIVITDPPPGGGGADPACRYRTNPPAGRLGNGLHDALLALAGAHVPQRQEEPGEQFR